jgi:hypothetical protein
LDSGFETNDIGRHGPFKTKGIMEYWNIGTMGKTYNIATKENLNPTFHHSILPPFHIELFWRNICLVS